MRSLSASLLEAQKDAGVTGASQEAIWKVVLSLSGQTTRGYDRARVLQIRWTGEEDSQIAEVLLQNSDGALTSIDFEYYQAILYRGYNTGVSRSAWVASTAYSIGDIVIPTTANGYQYRCTTAGTSHSSEPTFPTDLGVIVTETGGVVWEMDGDTGDEYSPEAPMKVDAQEFISSQTQMICRLYLLGIPNQMKQDKAESVYTQEDTDTNTIKTLITAISEKTLAPYTNYTSVSVVYDSEDSIIDAFKPKDYFSVQINESRDAKITELMNYTGCKRRAEDDGKIHIFDPTTTGTSYDYEYQLLVDTYHTFFEKALRNRFVSPNYEAVQSHPDHETQYAGNATSATSYALAPKIHTTYRRVTSNAECNNIASALIERYELDAERGSSLVPMNCGQEIWDWIKVTDGRQGDNRTGNVQYIQWNCKAPEIDGRGAFNMRIRFGRINTQSIGQNFGTLGVAGDGGTERADIISMYNALVDLYFENLNDIKTLFENDGSIIDYINAGVVPKWHITDQAIAPVITP